MKNQLWGKLLKGAIALSLATSITFPSIINAGQQNTVYADTSSRLTQFIDVPGNSYAEKHIYRLALQGITNGVYNEATKQYSFNYESSISRQEAVTMAIRFAGLEGQLNKNGIIEFQEGFKVGEFFKPYVDLAFEKGLLDEAEENQVAKDKPNQEWGATPASREWVTKLIVRTINQESLANSLANQEMKFYDRIIIDQKYAKYVNAAVQLGLVKGVTEHTFEPQNAIKRSAFATILSRAQKDFPVKAANQVSGILIAQTDDELTVIVDGKETTVKTDSTTGYYMANNDFGIAKSQLVQYSTVNIISSSDVAKFVEMESTEQNVENVEYTVLLTNAAKNSITVNDNNSAKEIILAETTKLVNDSGVELKFSDFKARDKIQVLLPTYSNDAAPIRVVKVLNGESGDVIQGKLLDLTSDYIIVNMDGETITKKLVQNPTVVIKNLENSTLSSLLKGTDEVILTLNNLDEVTAINVESRNIISYDYAKLVSLNLTEGLLTVKKDVVPLVTRLTENSKIYVDGNEVSQELMKNYTSWTNISVDFVAFPINLDTNVYDYQILRLDLHAELTATYLGIDTTKKIVSFELSTKEKLNIPYNAITMIHPTRSNMLVSELVKGQTYTAILDTNSLTLTSFVIEETINAKVTNTYPHYNDENNGQVILAYNSTTNTVDTKNVKVLKANGTAGTLKDIKNDANVKLQFKGRELKAIILP